MILGLSHISLSTNSLKKVHDFYIKKLGLKVIHKFTNKNKEIYGYFISANNNTFLEFFNSKKKINFENKNNKFRHLCFEVKNISKVYFDAYEHMLKRLKEFRPEFILMSAGFDAHEDDPLCQLNLKSRDYYEITRRVLETTKQFCDGKVVSILEGGYDLNALADSANEHVNALIEFS